MKSETEIQNAIELYADMIQKLCVIHLKQAIEVDDVFQNVFLKYAHSKPFHNQEHEKAWILRVTLNCCHDHWRFINKQPLPLNEQNVYDPTENKQDFTYVLDAVRQLPEKKRTVIYLYYYEGYKIKEIASIMKKQENTIHTWLRRAKLQLKEILGGDDFA